MAQLPLKFELLEPYSLRYFVPHSGTAEALAVFDRCLNDIRSDSSIFRLVFVYGPAGSGKSHLCLGYRELAIAQGILESRISLYKLEDLSTVEAVRAFIDSTERARAEGGFIIVEGRTLPTEQNELTSHVTSRLLSGYTVKLGYPIEEELKPLLLSILERRSLRLPEHSVKNLLRLLPTNPLSMERIIRAIDELALTEQRKVGKGIILEALSRTEQR